MRKSSIATLIVSLVLTPYAHAKPISITVPKSLAGQTFVLTNSHTGAASTAKVSSLGRVSMKTSYASFYMDVQARSGKVLPIYAKAGSKFHPVFRAATLGTVALKDSVLRTHPKRSDLSRTTTKRNLLTRFAATSSNYGIHRRKNTASLSSVDSDGDGLPDSLDIDDQNSGQPDHAVNTSSITSKSIRAPFPLFSNLKLPIEDSLNVSAAALTDAQIDATVSSSLTLAIGLANSSAVRTELDCGRLSYCSLGGSGTDLQSHLPFPAQFDTNGNGLGEISAGATGDYQLLPGATSTEIGSGDLLVQRVTDASSTTTKSVSVLNFAFITTPAAKVITVTSNGASTPHSIDYSITAGRLGSTQNCIQAPASGDVRLDIEAWRPQRRGVTGAGESSFMDIGGLRIVIDLPNSPCTLAGQGGCSGQGPGNCLPATYSTGDPNLSATPFLHDLTSDAVTSPSNTFTFSVDLSSCLTQNISGNSFSWGAGETVYVDLQMSDDIGDNAAQKFCVTRLPS